MGRARFELPESTETRYDPETVGGGKQVIHHDAGHTDGDGTLVSGAPEGWDETNRFRGLGAAAAQRQAYQADFGKALGDEQRGLQARDQQDAGLRTMRQAAMGNAPSQAAILGGQVGGQSLQASMQGAAGSRGLGAAAAQMQAAQAQQGAQLAGLGQFTGMRGNEMAHAQGAFGAAAGQMRSGDYSQQGMAQQRADAQAQSEMGQRQLNQAGQMGFEQMAINNQQAQSDADLRRDQMQTQANADQQAAHDARNARYMNLAVAGGTAMATGGASLAGGGGKTIADNSGAAGPPPDGSTGSDERMKKSIRPIGGLGAALARLREMHRDQEQGGADERDVSTIRGMDPDAKQRRDLHRAMEESTVGAHPYANEREATPVLGVSGAPEGYYASRQGQVGDVLGRGPQASYGEPQAPQLAPGTTDDFGSKHQPDGYSRAVMLSDDKTKLAKAWEEGHKAAIGDVQTLRMKSPEELKALGAKGNSLANAVRGAKADAYDQARGVPQHIMTVPPELQRPPPQPQEVQASGQVHQQPSAPVRRAAVDSVEREIPDTRPNYQKLVNQTLFGTPDMSDESLQASMGSDKRMKEDAHEEGEMGRQLAAGFKPFEYEYKPEFAGHEGQKQGEKNVGPMAQDMAANPITATAVSKRPDGLLQIDIPKVTKINSAGIGYLAAELQKLKERR